MARLRDDNGQVFLDGDDFDLKIDANRIVYIRKKGDNTYKSIDKEIPVGYDINEKKKYLYDLYEMIRAKRLERIDNRQFL